jgi:hypothetical protein
MPHNFYYIEKKTCGRTYFGQTRFQQTVHLGC